MDPVVRVPIVSQVEARIKELIDSKKYTEGMKLPTENELCQNMKVGRGTVREALRLLQELARERQIIYLTCNSSRCI